MELQLNSPSQPRPVDMARKSAARNIPFPEIPHMIADAELLANFNFSFGHAGPIPSSMQC